MGSCAGRLSGPPFVVFVVVVFCSLKHCKYWQISRTLLLKMFLKSGDLVYQFSCLCLQYSFCAYLKSQYQSKNQQNIQGSIYHLFINTTTCKIWSFLNNF